MRVGGATDLAAAGVAPDTIRQLGRWDSSTYRAYTRVSLAHAAGISAALGGVAHHDPSLEAAFPGFHQPA